MTLLSAERSARLRRWVLASPRRLRAAVRLGYVLNGAGIRLAAYARELVAWINSHVTDEHSDRIVRDLPALHRRIAAILERQKTEYGRYYYFHGQPYQSFATLGIFGERPTEERFDIYGLRELLKRDDRVLDIGCNCGFMAINASYRTGCRAVGIDINPYMIEIGRNCAEYLGVGDRVSLQATRIQDFVPDGRFTVVFSFATHWTDDGNYRVSLLDHLGLLHGLLEPGGLLVFESHCADVGQASFYDAMETARGLFDWSERIFSDNAQREVYFMRARPQGGPAR